MADELDLLLPTEYEAPSASGDSTDEECLVGKAPITPDATCVSPGNCPSCKLIG